jgi:aspartate aminotransferase
MTGWRIGWTICPEPLAKAIGNLQSQETSNPCSVSQHAALAALTGPQACVAEMCRAFQLRRDLVAARLRNLPGVRIPDIGGAFYAFFDIRADLARGRGGITTSMQWCEALLEQEHVALVAGSAFGSIGSPGSSPGRDRHRNPGQRPRPRGRLSLGAGSSRIAA